MVQKFFETGIREDSKIGSPAVNFVPDETFYFLAFCTFEWVMLSMAK